MEHVRSGASRLFVTAASTERSPMPESPMLIADTGSAHRNNAFIFCFSDETPEWPVNRIIFNAEKMRKNSVPALKANPR